MGSFFVLTLSVAFLLHLEAVYSEYSSWQFSPDTMGYDDEHIISSPHVTHWGQWGPWAYCPPNMYARAIEVKSESPNVDDHTALNAIELRCDYLGVLRDPYDSNEMEDFPYIKSLEGPFGTWRGMESCEGPDVIGGFMLRTQKRTIFATGDDYGASNIIAYCIDPTGRAGDAVELDAHGERMGEWSEPQMCAPGYAVCGMRTQVEISAGDDTGLNNVDMMCCLLPMSTQFDYGMPVGARPIYNADMLSSMNPLGGYNQNQYGTGWQNNDDGYWA